MTPSQEKWNKRIKAAGKKAVDFSQETLSAMIREGGSMWRYEGPSYNNDNFRSGFEQTFGKRDDIGSNLAKEK